MAKDKKPPKAKPPTGSSEATGLKAIQEINKKYGQGSIMTLDSTAMVKCEVISTGDMGIDIALGVGGVPRGRVIEIYGPESSGKTTLCLHIIANVQNSGGTAAFIDAEHALDPVWASKIGVNIPAMLFAQPDTGEQALDTVEILVRGGDLDVIVVDSVAALIPRAELEGEMGDSHVGLQARMMSQALRKLTGIVKKSRTTVIFINQMREKIGVMFGNPETTPGGKALKFYASVRMDIRKIGVLKDGENPIASKTKVKIVKNKVAPPFKEAETAIYFGTPVSGFDLASSLRDMALKYDIITSSGSWHNYGSIRLGNGALAVANFLRENVDLASEIRTKVLEKISPKNIVSSEEEAGFHNDEPADFDEDEDVDTALSTTNMSNVPPTNAILSAPPSNVVVDNISDESGIDDLIEEATGAS